MLKVTQGNPIVLTSSNPITGQWRFLADSGSTVDNGQSTQIVVQFIAERRVLIEVKNKVAGVGSEHILVDALARFVSLGAP